MEVRIRKLIFLKPSVLVSYNPRLCIPQLEDNWSKEAVCKLETIPWRIWICRLTLFPCLVPFFLGGGGSHVTDGMRYVLCRVKFHILEWLTMSHLILYLPQHFSTYWSLHVHSWMDLHTICFVVLIQYSQNGQVDYKDFCQLHMH